MYLFDFSSAVFSFAFVMKASSDEIFFNFILLICVVSCEQFLIFCMAWSDAMSSFFPPPIYIFAFFSCVDCFDGIKHSFASIQLNAFSMANWAPQSRVLISRTTHPSFCSFLSPSALKASGVNCTVKTLQTCTHESEESNANKLNLRVLMVHRYIHAAHFGDKHFNRRSQVYARVKL